MMKQLTNYHLRVYIEDTDCGGVVYHSNYLKFMERARSEWLYCLGYDEQKLKALQLGFAVRSANINYLLPARVGQELIIETHVKHVRRSAVLFLQKIFNKVSGKHLAEGEIQVVAVDLEKFKPTAIPVELLNYFKEECINA